MSILWKVFLLKENLGFFFMALTNKTLAMPIFIFLNLRIIFSCFQQTFCQLVSFKIPKSVALITLALFIYKPLNSPIEKSPSIWHLPPSKIKHNNSSISNKNSSVVILTKPLLPHLRTTSHATLKPQKVTWLHLSLLYTRYAHISYLVKFLSTMAKRYRAKGNLRRGRRKLLKKFINATPFSIIHRVLYVGSICWRRYTRTSTTPHRTDQDDQVEIYKPFYNAAKPKHSATTTHPYRLLPPTASRWRCCWQPFHPTSLLLFHSYSLALSIELINSARLFISTLSLLTNPADPCSMHFASMWKHFHATARARLPCYAHN